MALSSSDREQIQQMMVNFSNKSQFGVSAVQHHTHNSVDSPKISYTNLTNTPQTTFAGSINTSGSASFLPSGWSSVRTGTGVYKITHNLGTSNYAVAATSLGQINVIYYIDPPTPVSFTINSTSSLGITPLSNAFLFVLIVQQ